MITVRRIQWGEAALYRQIRLAALKDAPYAFQTTYESALQRTDAMWQDRVVGSALGSDDAIFLAFSDALPIGLAALVRSRDQPGLGELMQVWVHPDHRGTEAAWDLMDTVFKWAAENRFHTIQAGVTKVNARALRFYASYGFSRMDEVSQIDFDSVYLMREVGSE